MLARIFNFPTASRGFWAFLVCYILALAALSPLGLYYVAWDAVLNHSNTVLMAAAIAATVYALARVAKGGAGQCLLVWQAEAGAAPPRELIQLATGERVLAEGGAARFAAAKLLRASERVFRIGYVLWPAGRGDCR